MKKYILGIVIVIAVIFVSGCISSSDSNNSTHQQEPQTLAKNGILIKYPGTWVDANSKNNETIAAVADPNSVDSNNGFGKVSVVVQKRTMNTSGVNSSFDEFFNQTYDEIFSNSDYKLIANGKVSVGAYKNASEVLFTVGNGTAKKQRAIWIQSGKDVYVILCTAPEAEFESQSKNFDFILNSFKIT